MPAPLCAPISRATAPTPTSRSFSASPAVYAAPRMVCVESDGAVQVRDIKLIEDRVTHRFKGIAYVEFEDMETAMRVGPPHPVTPVSSTCRPTQ